MAKDLEIGLRTLQRYEDGKLYPSVAFVIKMAMYLNCLTSDLFPKLAFEPVLNTDSDAAFIKLKSLLNNLTSEVDSSQVIPFFNLLVEIKRNNINPIELLKESYSLAKQQDYYQEKRPEVVVKNLESQSIEEIFTQLRKYNIDTTFINDFLETMLSDMEYKHLAFKEIFRSVYDKFQIEKHVHQLS